MKKDRKKVNMIETKILKKLRKKTEDFLTMNLIKNDIRFEKYRKYTNNEQDFIKWMIKKEKTEDPIFTNKLLKKCHSG